MSAASYLTTHPGVSHVDEESGIVRIHPASRREREEIMQATVEAGFTVESGVSEDENGEYFEIGTENVAFDPED